ncbi:MAG: hypothetical protein ABIG37_02065 [Nanoarchaeota archaeon]|nr:hypothetical protein [Nanoarchaeota archaeon]
MDHIQKIILLFALSCLEISLLFGVVYISFAVALNNFDYMKLIIILIMTGIFIRTCLNYFLS